MTGQLPLYSDVVNITGVTPAANGNVTPSGNLADTYALQMSYDWTALGSTQAYAAQQASNGFIYLGFRSQATGQWVPAIATSATYTGVTDGNTGIGLDAYDNGTVGRSLGPMAATRPGSGVASLPLPT